MTEFTFRQMNVDSFVTQVINGEIPKEKAINGEIPKEKAIEAQKEFEEWQSRTSISDMKMYPDE